MVAAATSHGLIDENRAMRTAVGVVLVIAGSVWVLQGLEIAFAPESFMTGDRSWVIWGVLAIVIGGALAWWDWRS